MAAYGRARVFVRVDACVFMFKSSGLLGVDVCGGLLSFVEKQCVSRILEIMWCRAYPEWSYLCRALLLKKCVFSLEIVAYLLCL